MQIRNFNIIDSFKMKIAKRIISKHYWTKHTLTNKTCDVDSKIWLCILWYSIKSCYMQKQLTRGVLRKRCSKNMQQIDRRTPMPECGFKKSCKASLLKPHFAMSVLLKIWGIFSKHFFLRTPLDGCFYICVFLYCYTYTCSTMIATLYMKISYGFEISIVYTMFTLRGC